MFFVDHAVESHHRVVQAANELLRHKLRAPVDVFVQVDLFARAVVFIEVVEDEARPLALGLARHAMACGQDEIQVDERPRAVGDGGLLQEALARTEAPRLLEILPAKTHVARVRGVEDVGAHQGHDGARRQLSPNGVWVLVDLDAIVVAVDDKISASPHLFLGCNAAHNQREQGQSTERSHRRRSLVLIHDDGQILAQRRAEETKRKE